MKKDIEYWLNLAQYDIETAQAMLKGGRYLYVLFTCQQAVEKILKALLIQNTEKFPPKIHDLLRLTNLANVEVSEEQSQFLAKLNFYYLETRYPEQIIDLSKEITEKTATTYYDKTKELFEWLKTKVI